MHPLQNKHEHSSDVSSDAEASRERQTSAGDVRTRRWRNQNNDGIERNYFHMKNFHKKKKAKTELTALRYLYGMRISDFA